MASVLSKPSPKFLDSMARQHRLQHTRERNYLRPPLLLGEADRGIHSSTSVFNVVRRHVMVCLRYLDSVFREWVVAHRAYPVSRVGSARVGVGEEERITGLDEARKAYVQVEAQGLQRIELRRWPDICIRGRQIAKEQKTEHCFTMEANNWELF